MARVWRRRRSSDFPRPAGRRWARLRRGGSRATQVFARVTRRHREPSASVVTAGEQVIYPQHDRAWRRIGARRPAVSTREATALAPVSPAIAGAFSSTADLDRAVPATIPLLPGERTMSRRVKFVLANACTVASLVLGMSAAFLAIGGNITLAALSLLACVVFDGLDGALARKFGVASPFGAQMDSMADLGSFGVATGIVVYQWLIAGGASGPTAASVSALVAVCAAVRLARFNVSPKDGRYFCGVPTTMAAAVLALNTLLGPSLPAQVQAAIVGVYALAMVTSFPYAKLARIARLPLWLWVFPAICAMISPSVTFAGIVGVYLISGPLLWLYHRRRQGMIAA